MDESVRKSHSYAGGPPKFTLPVGTDIFGDVSRGAVMVVSPWDLVAVSGLSGPR